MAGSVVVTGSSRFPMYSETINLLAQRHLRTIKVEQYVDWALACLESNIDTHSIRILASLQKPLYSSEVEDYFQRGLTELGWTLPSGRDCLLPYVRALAKQIASGAIAPVEGCRKIYKIVVALDYPADLSAWVYLDEGQLPGNLGDVEAAELDAAIVREARRLIDEEAG